MGVRELAIAARRAGIAAELVKMAHASIRHVHVRSYHMTGSVKVMDRVADMLRGPQKMMSRIVVLKGVAEESIRTCQLTVLVMIDRIAEMCVRLQQMIAGIVCLPHAVGIQVPVQHVVRHLIKKSKIHVSPQFTDEY